MTSAWMYDIVGPSREIYDLSIRNNFFRIKHGDPYTTLLSMSTQGQYMLILPIHKNSSVLHVSVPMDFTGEIIETADLYHVIDARQRWLDILDHRMKTVYQYNVLRAWPDLHSFNRHSNTLPFYINEFSSLFPSISTVNRSTMSSSLHSTHTYTPSSPTYTVVAHLYTVVAQPYSVYGLFNFLTYSYGQLFNFVTQPYSIHGLFNFITDSYG